MITLIFFSLIFLTLYQTYNLILTRYLVSLRLMFCNTQNWTVYLIGRLLFYIYNKLITLYNEFMLHKFLLKLILSTIARLTVSNTARLHLSWKKGRKQNFQKWWIKLCGCSYSTFLWWQTQATSGQLWGKHVSVVFPLFNRIY